MKTKVSGKFINYRFEKNNNTTTFIYIVFKLKVLKEIVADIKNNVIFSIKI